MPHESGAAYDYINRHIIPRVVEHFQAKQADYRAGPAFLLLGSRGQFSDINRKFWKLYKAVWEGEPLQGEQAEEIVEDFIGHCLLMLFCLEQEGVPTREDCTCPPDQPADSYREGCPYHEHIMSITRTEENHHE